MKVNFGCSKLLFKPKKAKVDEIVLPPCVQTAISWKPFELQGWDWSQRFQNLILYPIWVLWEFTTIKFELKIGPHYRKGVKNTWAQLDVEELFLN